MICIYLVPIAALAILWLMSKDTELPAGIKDEGISREFLKISFFIYEKLGRNKRSFEEEKIRGYLTLLNSKKDIRQAETEYFIRKIALVLAVLLAGSFLAAVTYLGSRTGNVIEDNDTLYRKDYGDGDFTVDLIAKDVSGEEIGEYDFVVKERVYTDPEADELFEEASKAAEEIVLNNNASFDEVSTDLILPEKIEGYPFLISWKADNYELIHYDGRLEKEKIPKEGAIVNLTATYKYNERSWKQEFAVRLIQQNLSPQEKIRQHLGKLLSAADEETMQEEKIKLPADCEGEEVIWSEKTEDSSLAILVLAIISACFCYVYKDRELKKEIEDRQKQMLSDYPQLVSQLVLYLGAGMTTRNIFECLAKRYLKERETGREKRFVYEELVRTSRELSSGISESEAYERFGVRCIGQQYTRLATLLSQNLRKGNAELLKVLGEESKNAFGERMANVRKLGEEAGTKLLLPMILMLLIVMVVVMIPAYMTF